MIMCGEWRSSLTIGRETLENHVPDIYPAAGLYTIIAPFVTNRFTRCGFPVNFKVVDLQIYPREKAQRSVFRR